MLGFYENGNYGVPADGNILTANGWQPLSRVCVGDHLAHPSGASSRLAAVRPLGERHVLDLVLADTSRITCTPDQPLRVRLGGGTKAPVHTLTASQVLDALRRQRPVRLMRDAAYQYGVVGALPLDGYLLGVLLACGSARNGEVSVCSREPELHALVRETIPEGTVLGEVRFDNRNTPRASLINVHGEDDSPLQRLRQLELLGRRANEKFIPSDYMLAPLPVRLAVLQGLFDVTGSVDQFGRVAFDTSSPLLAEQVAELVVGVAGRARLRRTAASPNQHSSRTDKNYYRLANVRLPEEVAPFRLPRKLARIRPRSFARHWTVRLVEPAGTTRTVEVQVTAPDRRWIGGNAAPFIGSLVTEDVVGQGATA